MGRPEDKFAVLLKLADSYGVQVEFIDNLLGEGADWHGLYIRDSEYGAGIAINSQLSPDWKTWILAHELGHHRLLGDSLFSPFVGPAAAHKVDEKSRNRWGSWRRLNRDEDAANKWAAVALIGQDEWAEAENRFPCDLSEILRHLGLPAPAAIAWERVRRETGTFGRQYAKLRLSGEQKDILCRPIKGTGGHQGFFRRLHSSLVIDTITLLRSDFSYARERAARDRGGWRIRYQAVLDCVSENLRMSGLVLDHLFARSYASAASI